MHPTLVREPFHRAGWIYEEKVDGWRIVAYKDGDRVRLVSRNAVDHTRRVRGLAAAVASLSARRRLAPDGLQAWAQVVERGYEGFVAKDDASPYEGGPTKRWLKVKQKNWTVERIAGDGGSSGRTGDDAARSQSFAGCRAASPRVGRLGVRRVRVGVVGQ
jgi:ATP-dependent DNA ligase